MAEVTINIEGRERFQRKIAGFERALPKHVRVGLTAAGSILSSDMSRRLHGPSHSKSPGNPYPGVVSGQLSKVFYKVDSRGTSVTIAPGPLSAKYAPIQALGGTIEAKAGGYLRFQINGQWVSVKKVTIPARDWRPDSVEQAGPKAIDALTDAIMKGYDRS